MSKKISFCVLSKKELDKAIEELKSYKNELNEKIDLFVRKLAEKGVDIAKNKVSVYNKIDTGTLQDSINFKAGDVIKDGSVYYVYTDCEYASFVEFGTGVVGEESSYPYTMPDGMDWNYASGQHIKTLKDGRVGWFFPTDDGYRFTEGQASSPFMTETAIELSMQIVEVAKEVFGGASDS